MILYWSFGAAIAYAAGVLALNFAPESLLQRNRERLSERIAGRHGVLCLGVLLLLIAGSTFDETTGRIKLDIALRWGLLPAASFSAEGLFRPLVSSLLHWDFVHLISNVSVLLFLLPYEKRVGSKRFLAVFLFSAIVVELVESLLPLGPRISLGASGGICGLVTAANVDRSNMAGKEWCARVLLSFLFIGFVSAQSYLRPQSALYSVDWIAHILAVPVAAAFCFLVRRDPDRTSPIAYAPPLASGAGG